MHPISFLSIIAPISQEIQPPDSLRDILPELGSLIEDRRQERKYNLRANEVFLEAKGILENMGQTKETEEKDLFGKEQTFRETPPVSFTHLDQKVSIRVKDDVELNSANEKSM